ncbi:hypothetical protein [Actinoplanes sp. NPDC049802]|uniref:hypothetical protein n=1 Tax=Actinoplanes sp. NPDC049802 TaxID=3154742 RepID=UPI0033D1BB3D
MFESTESASFLRPGTRLLDVDHLKLVNDTYGHDDAIGSARGRPPLEPERFRSHDVVARCGGEGFTILLPRCLSEGCAGDRRPHPTPPSSTYRSGCRRHRHHGDRLGRRGVHPHRHGPTDTPCRPAPVPGEEHPPGPSGHCPRLGAD